MSVKREITYIKNQNKNFGVEMKKSLEVPMNRFELEKERINELKDRLIEIIQSEKQKEQIIKNDSTPELCGTAANISTYA